MYELMAPVKLSQGDIINKVLLLDSAVPAASPGERNVIILSHDCEIDKPSNEVLIVAEVKLLAEMERIKSGIKGDIQKGRVRNVMYLEPYGQLAESYVDFRYIFRVAKKSLEENLKLGLRIASLNEESKQALCIFFERYLFRKLPSETQE